MELVICTKDDTFETVDQALLENLVKVVKTEKEEEEAKKNKKL